MSSPKSHLVVGGLIFLTCLPVIYGLAVIQYSAVAYPYYDHMNLVRYLSSYYDGTLSVADLFSGQAQTRPFFPRLIFVLNAIATDWDVRSEFTYIILSIHGTFLVFLYYLRHSLSGDRLAFAIAALVTSIFVFSPVANTNFWWSLMLLETLAVLLATISLLIVSYNRESWGANVAAALVAWAAAYSLSNGIFVFAALFIAHQLAGPRLFALNRFAIFWLANLVLLCAIYVPGLPLAHGHPSFSDFIWFTFADLGNPLASLLWYRYTTPFDTPRAMAFNAAFGVIFLLVVMITLPGAHRRLRNGLPEAFVFISFAGFAAISVIVTAVGRAGLAVHGANSPRYSTFSAYLILGLVIYCAAVWVRERPGTPLTSVRKYVALGLFVIFIGCSAAAYVRAVPVYRLAHDFNQVAASAYPPDAGPTELDRLIYPNVEEFRSLKRTLHRLGLGPYSQTLYGFSLVTSGPYIRAVPLKAGTKVVQSFTIDGPPVGVISMAMVNWGRTPSSYTIDWKIIAKAADRREVIGHGELAAATVIDWQQVEFPIGVRPDFTPEALEVEFSVGADQPSADAAGLTLYRAASPKAPPQIEIDGSPVTDGGVLNVRYKFRKN
jgi:hypothetical protein